MVRPYGVKVHKRKKREENYDREEEEEVEEQSIQAAKKKTTLSSTTQGDDSEKKAEKEDGEEAPVEVLEGIPAAPSDQEALKRGVIFVLERASLEVGKVGKVCELRALHIS